MDGLKTLPSDFKLQETIDRVVSLIHSKGFTIFALIDHGAEAMRQGLPLRPTKLVIFGNPKVGTILMQDRQTAGIDLPAKILVWQDESGKVWLTYNKMNPLKARHQLTDNSNAILKHIEEVAAGICHAAGRDE